MFEGVALVEGPLCDLSSVRLDDFEVVQSGVAEGVRLRCAVSVTESDVELVGVRDPHVFV